jgi:trimeric autotransporter adhesin
VPQTVTIPAGTASANFTASAGQVTQNVNVSLLATANNTTQKFTLLIESPVLLSKVNCGKTTILSGTSLSCTVYLNKATQSDVTILFSSDDPSILSAPASVSIPARYSFTTMTVSAGTVSSSTIVRLTGSLNGGTITLPLTVQTPGPSALVCGTTLVPSQGTTTCTITLGAAPVADLPVALLSSSTAITVPASVTVQAGSTSATFTATAKAVTVQTRVTLSASASGAKQDFTLYVQKP